TISVLNEDRAMTTTRSIGQHSNQDDQLTQRPQTPTFRNWTSLRLSVPSMRKALKFYGERLGLLVSWYRSADTWSGPEVGFELPGTEAELVVNTYDEDGDHRILLLVDDIEIAAQTLVAAGAEALEMTQVTEHGKRAVVRDPFGNDITLLELELDSTPVG